MKILVIILVQLFVVINLAQADNPSLIYRTSLSSPAYVTPVFGGVAQSLGQQPMAESLSCAISSDQSPIPVTGSFSSNLHDGSGTPITSTNISGKQGLDVNVISSSGGSSTVNQGTGGVSPWLVTGTGGTFPVTGTFWQTTQPISASSLPLPTGAATQTTLASILSALGSPFQAGGSISNTSFQATQSLGSNLHVDVDNFPGTQPVSIASPVAVTGTFYQSTQPVSIASSVPVTGTFFQSTQPVSIASSVAVTGTFFQATQPVSIASSVPVTQSTNPWTDKIVDGSGNVWGPVVAISGINYQPVVLAASGATGSAVPARTIQVGGSDGTNERTFATDALGIQQVTLANTNKTVKMLTGNISTTSVTANQTILTYTVTVGKTFYLQYFKCTANTEAAAVTATAFGACSLQIGGSTVYTDWLHGDGENNYPIGQEFAEAIPIAGGTTIQLITTPFAVTAFYWYGNFGGYEK